MSIRGWNEADEDHWWISLNDVEINDDTVECPACSSDAVRDYDGAESNWFRCQCGADLEVVDDEG